MAAWRHEWAQYDTYSKEGEIEDLASNATPDTLVNFKALRDHGGKIVRAAVAVPVGIGEGQS